jgi:hypothetical protein
MKNKKAPMFLGVLVVAGLIAFENQSESNFHLKKSVCLLLKLSVNSVCPNKMGEFGKY